tara:strand:- start:113 stop:577 length:465 start_codon:yes stop_codon:yes gene_type:complete
MISKSSKGFSLIELLVVVGIVGILAAIGTVSYQGYVKSSKRTAAQNIVQQTALAQTEEYSNAGSYILTEALGDGAAIRSAECEASSASSDAIEDGLFSGDDIITSQIKFEMCVVGNTSTYKVIAKEYDKSDPYEWSGCEISLVRNSLPERNDSC